MEPSYDTVVFSGASVKGFSTLGALYYLEQEKKLDMSLVDVLIGTSSGSINCYLLSIGYTTIEIVQYMCKHKVFETFQADVLSPFQGKGGLYSFSNVLFHLQNMTLEKIGQFVTLSQVKKMFGKTLIFATYNFTKNSVEYLTPDTHPDLPCLVAIHMSSNLPIIFGKFKYQNCYYIDGGIEDNFPIDQVPDFGSRTVLGISINVMPTHYDLDQMTLGEYMQAIFHTLCHSKTKNKIQLYSLKNNCKIYNLHIRKEKWSGFQFDHRFVLDLFVEGYNCIRKIPNQKVGVGESPLRQPKNRFAPPPPELQDDHPECELRKRKVD